MELPFLSGLAKRLRSGLRPAPACRGDPGVHASATGLRPGCLWHRVSALQPSGWVIPWEFQLPQPLGWGMPRRWDWLQASAARALATA